MSASGPSGPLVLFCFYFQTFFLVSPEKNSKTSKVNQQSVLNL